MALDKNANLVSHLKSSFQSGALRQLLFMVGTALSVAVGIAIFMSIQEPTYRALDYQITQRNMSSIIDTLDKAGIQYKINERDGVVLVPAKDIEAARLKLSSAGVSKNDGFSYSFLNDQNSFGNSQFLENARYIRALENELSKTISSIEGVSGARVHIAIPRNNVFADENNKVTASVMLNISAGFMSNKEKIRSILQIIADSVPGLDPKDVAITDQYGHFLSEGMDQNSIYSAAQLNYQNNLQSYYEKRIESMIVPLLGENKVIVRVNAVLDFTQNENAKEEYDPAKSVLLSEQSDSSVEETAGGASGPPGALSNSPPEEEKGEQAEKGSGSQSPQGGSGQRRSQSTKNYNVSKSVTYKKSNVAELKSLSVAIVVDNEMILNPKTKIYESKPLPKEKIDKITELVKTVIGFDEKRGDKVTVVNSVYTQMKQDIPPIKQHLWENPWFWDVTKKILGILLGFIFLFFVYRKLSKLMSMPINPPSPQKSIFVTQENDLSGDSIQRMHEIKEDGINKLKQFALSEPTKVASIIKNWVGK